MVPYKTRSNIDEEEKRMLTLIFLFGGNKKRTSNSEHTGMVITVYSEKSVQIRQCVLRERQADYRSYYFFAQHL